ncbi:hypothetical protein Anapl_07762 [Anas platyrhynchos]|uniref:Uncharacterized protein n=1 Tax=Anas platyrhynchos TaxID=8839 RepID=R0LKN4_ANAPL|nr:hypothetical protein Anapl_07762 [Anas platyrhynchos]
MSSRDLRSSAVPKKASQCPVTAAALGRQTPGNFGQPEGGAGALQQFQWLTASKDTSDGDILGKVTRTDLSKEEDTALADRHLAWFACTRSTLQRECLLNLNSCEEWRRRSGLVFCEWMCPRLPVQSVRHSVVTLYCTHLVLGSAANAAAGLVSTFCMRASGTMVLIIPDSFHIPWQPDLPLTALCGIADQAADAAGRGITYPQFKKRYSSGLSDLYSNRKQSKSSRLQIFRWNIPTFLLVPSPRDDVAPNEESAESILDE